MTYEIILRDQNGNETILESEIKDSKKHEFSTVVNGNYDTIGTKLSGVNYYVRHNRIALFFDRLTVEKEPTVINDVPENWEQIDCLKLPKLRSHLGVGPVTGLTTEKAKKMLAEKLGIEIPNDTAKIEPKTTKVEQIDQPFNGQDAKQVDGNNALITLGNALNSGHITLDTYLQQVALLQKNGIIK